MSNMADNTYMNKKIPTSGVADPKDVDNIQSEALRQQFIKSAFRAPALHQLNPDVGRVDKRYGRKLREYSFKDPDEINEQYANVQSGLNQIGRGLISMGVLAGTTYMDTLVGNLAQGIAWLSGSNEGPSNRFSEWLRKRSDNRMQNAPIYKSQGWENKSLLGQLVTPEFWGDFLQNQGFTLGMMGANATLSFIPLAGPILAAGFSAMSEARQEAMGLKDDMEKELYGQIVNQYNQDRFNARSEEDLLIAREKLNESAKAATSDINKAVDFANKSNMALLMATNLITWGKVMSRGAKGYNKIKESFRQNNLKRASRRPIVQTTIDASKVLKGMVSEGFEEYSQSAIQKATEYIPDMNEFATAPYHSGEAQEMSTGWIDAMLRSYGELAGDKETWRQTLMGALGSLGTVTFQNPKTPNKWRSPINFDGSIPELVRDIRTDIDLRQKKAAVETAVNSGDLKKQVVDFTRIVDADLKKDKAANIKDDFNFKNYDLQGFLSTIIAADDLGMMDTIDKIIQSASEISEDEWQNIADTITTPEGQNTFYTKEENSNNKTLDKGAVKRKVDENLKKLQDLKTLYLEQKEILDNSGKEFNDDAKKNYIYGIAQLKDWDTRSTEMLNELNTQFKSLKDVNWEDITIPVKGKEGEINVTASSRAALLSTKEGRKAIRKQLPNMIPLQQDREEVEKKLNDLDKISDGRDKFIKQLNSYWDNPIKAALLIDEATNEDILNNTKETYQKNVDKYVVGATSLEDFTHRMDHDIDEGTRLSVKEDITSVSDNEKPYIKQYNNIDNYRDALVRANSEFGKDGLNPEKLKSLLSNVKGFKSPQEYKDKVEKTLRGRYNKRSSEFWDNLMKKVADQQALDKVAENSSKDKSNNSDRDYLNSLSLDEVIEIADKFVDSEDDKKLIRKQSKDILIDSILDSMADNPDIDIRNINKPKTAITNTLPDAKKEDGLSPDELENDITNDTSNDLSPKDYDKELKDQADKYNTPVPEGDNTWHVNRRNTKYNIDKLREGVLEENPVNWIRQVLNQVHAEEFISSGKLYDWAVKQDKEGKPRTIRLVIIRPKGEKVKSFPIFAAIESDNPHAIDAVDSDGKRIKVQLLGTINTNDPTYKPLIETILKETEGFHEGTKTDTPSVTVSDSTSLLTKIYSGRMVLAGKGKSQREERTLAALTKNEDPDSWGLVIHTRHGDDIWFGQNQYNLRNNLYPIKAVNSAGKVYIATREADGKVYQKLATSTTFDNIWWENNSASPICQRIADIIQELSDNYVDTNIRTSNLKALHEILYMDKDHTLVILPNGTIKFGSDIVGSLSGGKMKDFRTLLDAVLNQGFHFTINNVMSLEDIVQSNILTSDILTLHNLNASLQISPLVRENERFVPYDNEEVKLDDTTPIKKGKTLPAARMRLNPKGMSTVFYDTATDKYYQLSGKKEIEITDEDTLSKYRTFKDIKEKKGSPVGYYKSKRESNKVYTFILPSTGQTVYMRKDGQILDAYEQTFIHTDKEIDNSYTARPQKKQSSTDNDEKPPIVQNVEVNSSIKLSKSDVLAVNNFINTVLDRIPELIPVLNNIAKISEVSDITDLIDIVATKYPEQIQSALELMKAEKYDEAYDYMMNVFGCI